ncbi:MAG TPA: uracil-DNA glycosylase family protein [Chitinophagaceae bacterium]|nr:uracil-DNA glycosylase family protein [Chitinophagaceae bacterium]
MKTFAQQLIQFYRQLKPPHVPKAIEVMHPQPDQEVMETVQKFFQKFYTDNNPRRLMLGINPGRFGAGITGVNFTAPKQLTHNCGIDHPWGNGTELSAEFIYEMITAYGGPSAFYSDHFIGAVCPLGFIKDEKNINYYDDQQLQQAVTPFIIDTLQQQVKMGFDRTICFCIGGEKNYKYLSALNEKHNFFQQIVPMAHPRFIMQYRRKRKKEYIEEWLHALKVSGGRGE